jgi:hypothetical protein
MAMARDSECEHCGGLVAAQRISAHPSGITIEYGQCVACGSQLRRILASGFDERVEAVGPWTAIPPPRPSYRSRDRHRTRPPRRVDAHRPDR